MEKENTFVAPEIINALQLRVNSGDYGCASVSDEWHDAVIQWWKTRHGFTLKKDWLLFSAGMMPSVSAAISQLTTPGAYVLVLSPAPGALFKMIEDHGRRVLESKLERSQDEYQIDFSDLEQKLSNPLTSLMLLENPHSPTGMTWKRDTLEKIGNLCELYQVTVLSDESGCDMRIPAYTPYASVSDACAQNSITYVTPSRAFYLDGLRTATAIIPNEMLRHKIRHGLDFVGASEPNILASDAAVAAFTMGGGWLEQEQRRLYESWLTAQKFFEQKMPHIKLLPSWADACLWMDCGWITRDSESLAQYIEEHTGLYLFPGAEGTDRKQRILCLKIASQLSQQEELLHKLQTGIQAYEEYIVSLC